jgi:hypothetical protein
MADNAPFSEGRAGGVCMLRDGWSLVQAGINQCLLGATSPWTDV